MRILKILNETAKLNIIKMLNCKQHMKIGNRFLHYQFGLSHQQFERVGSHKGNQRILYYYR
ncbi:unnamed protein product [Paramecium octaurelia]|uniref:Uncharacterized protein n=1 Tax=Paramecium octaurelia TaxID=43137 RepID=A0A8S1Y388_PAROT|nr:unnamed protein product [Paramecium octaurelia]